MLTLYSPRKPPARENESVPYGWQWEEEEEEEEEEGRIFPKISGTTYVGNTDVVIFNKIRYI